MSNVKELLAEAERLGEDYQGWDCDGSASVCDDRLDLIEKLRAALAAQSVQGDVKLLQNSLDAANPKQDETKSTHDFASLVSENLVAALRKAADAFHDEPGWLWACELVTLAADAIETAENEVLRVQRLAGRASERVDLRLRAESAEAEVYHLNLLLGHIPPPEIEAAEAMIAKYTKEER